MTENTTRFQEFVFEEAGKVRGSAVPKRVSLLHRILVRKVSVKKLHPNPDDEFCDPKIGPNDGIIQAYTENIREVMFHGQKDFIREPLIIEGIHPKGYMILNGHHRWAAALRMNIPRVPVRIVNLTHESDIKKMLENAKYSRRVALDLDEVVFLAGKGEGAEPAPSFPLDRIFSERLRPGVPALFHFLKTNGYDIWVYSSRYYSMEYIRACFGAYHVRVDGIVTGTARRQAGLGEERKRLEALIAGRYPETVHIDGGSVVMIDRGNRAYREFALSGDAGTWSREIMDVLKNNAPGEDGGIG